MSGLAPDLVASAAAVLQLCESRGLTLATAESCTGGLIAACLTAVPGSSAVVERGLVTYSNSAKSDLLGVPETLIAAHGAVSEAVARAMAAGVLQRAPVAVAVAVTGIAGPSGGSADKPVGLVHMAAARRDGPILHRVQVFPGDRDAVRHGAAAAALELLQQVAAAT